MTDPDADARRLAAQALAVGEATGWFEPLYASAADGSAIVPWDREAPNALLVGWASSTHLAGGGRRALVVGCSYGRDAEYLASLGFDVTAFDVSATAIEQARLRHPSSPVRYVTANLLALPPDWLGAFDFVLESHNVQALPDPPRAQAIAAVRSAVAPGGTLLVLMFASEDSAEPDGPPWPLTRSEIESFAGGEVRTVSIETETAEDGSLRWRAVFARE